MYKVTVTVKDVKGICDAYKVGDTLEILGDKVDGSKCEMALHTLFPFVFAMQYGAEFPWLRDKDTMTAYCPDPDGLVLFELKRVRT